MGKKCSYCRTIGHNTRTCNNHYKSTTPSLAGVQFGNVIFPSSSSPSPSPSLPSSSSSPSLRRSFASSNVHIDKTLDYNTLSIGDDISEMLIVQSQDRKKGASWTEDEHKAFLVGLEKMGRGDWRGISKNFVTTRTPTQIASHAQKYFLKQTSLNKKKRASCLFDMVESDTAPTSSATITISGDNESPPPQPQQHCYKDSHNPGEQHKECDNMERYEARYESRYLGLQIKSSKPRRMTTERLSSNEAPDLELTLRLLCH